MANVLIFSEDVNVRTWFEKSLADIGIFVRAVATSAATKEWLRTQRFEILVVDNRNKHFQGLPFFQEAWSIDPQMIGICVCFQENLTDPWSMKLAGVEIIEGENPRDKLLDYIKKVCLAEQNAQREGILVVDDLDSPRFIISTLISSFNIGNVICAENASSAFEILKARIDNFFCVITDINMPDHSGIELLQWIRNDRRTAHLPVVVLTSNSTTDNLFEALKEGATGFLAKPPKKQFLLSELSRAKRIFLAQLSPRMCAEEEVHIIKEEIERRIESERLLGKF